MSGFVTNLGEFMTRNWIIEAYVKTQTCYGYLSPFFFALLLLSSKFQYIKYI